MCVRGSLLVVDNTLALVCGFCTFVGFGFAAQVMRSTLRLELKHGGYILSADVTRGHPF